MSIRAIFYCKFDPLEGPKVIHQIPEDSIFSPSDNATSILLPSTPSSTPDSSNIPILSFPAISRFLIPRQSLCGNLVSLRPPPPTPQTPPTLILSHPICISSPHYPRNEFIFNFAVVLALPTPDSTSNLTTMLPSYKSITSKLAHLMSALESQSHFLSSDPSPPNTGPIYSLCESLMSDLNNYSECMTPLPIPTSAGPSPVNTLNVKLFPTYPDPPRVHAHYVPLLTVHISTLIDETWDLTMLLIIPYIDGIRSVKKIALAADADLKLTKKCIKHLIYYGCVLLLDIFSFRAIYAPTSTFTTTIACDEAMQRECARYVNTAFTPGRPHAGHDSAIQSIAVDSPQTGNSSFPFSRSAGSGIVPNIETDPWPLTAKGELVDGVAIVQLFASLRQGLDIRSWYGLNADMLANVDMRRLVTFGVIKGFLYRVHRYPFLVSEAGKGLGRERTEFRSGVQRFPGAGVGNSTVGVDGAGGGVMPRSMSSELHMREPSSTRPYRGANANRLSDVESDDEDWAGKLKPFLDGTHCFDEICTELEISERELEERLKKNVEGDVAIICR